MMERDALRQRVFPNREYTKSHPNREGGALGSGQGASGQGGLFLVAEQQGIAGLYRHFDPLLKWDGEVAKSVADLASAIKADRFPESDNSDDLETKGRDVDQG